nr:MAG TPA: hypothetical protein [Caudoviricetes sp.]
MRQRLLNESLSFFMPTFSSFFARKIHRLL